MPKKHSLRLASKSDLKDIDADALDAFGKGASTKSLEAERATTKKKEPKAKEPTEPKAKEGRGRPKLPIKEKAVRKTFSMQPSNFALLDQLIDKGMDARLRINKSDLIAAGLHVLRDMSLKDFAKAIDSVKK
ncbi:hypothetical protein [Candidatus Vondammii sp. HM_W22]|uniref:hypothetical protein n=1 Tax=Candidatus Vondammii sp. HM_W22 TaxID=2687299 RepID=UPI001F12AE4D|nr:hypothetical protein [Candidatus Vondammii sp. HM_W22]